MYGKGLHKAQCAKDRFLLIFKASFIPCPYSMHLCLIAVLAHNLLAKHNVGSSLFGYQVIHEQHGSFHLEIAWWELTLLILLYVSLKGKTDTCKVHIPLLEVWFDSFAGSSTFHYFSSCLKWGRQRFILWKTSLASTMWAGFEAPVDAPVRQTILASLMSHGKINIPRRSLRDTR